MKAKRIVSILLTGSMLLSLLPVSALAAAPVFDAPAQTTAKKAAPLVQEADASRSTEEEASTRSSRDLDAENGTAESITTIQLNAAGKPASEGNFGNWYYSAASGCQLDTGVFALQPSSEPEAESALKARLFRIGDNAELVRGTVGCETINYGTIFDGIFQGKVTNFRTISGGTFEEVVEMNESPDGVTIEGGTFKKGIKLNAGACYPIITDGLFDGKVSAAEGYSGTLSIRGGLFTKAVDISNTGLPNLQITGGYFVSEPTMPEGSDTGFTTVSDQDGRAFQVPVNGGWSENGYETLYVPHGSSNPSAFIKTNTKLTDCLAGDVSIMETLLDFGDNTYGIPVQNYEKIVLVTEEPAPPTPGEPGGELDPEFSPGAAALGVVLGTAGLGYITYICGSSLYLSYVLPDGFIPSTQQELATVLWTTAGKPDPVSTALYTDISADSIELQKAARWCAEQGLLSDHGTTFGADARVTNARIIRAWNSLKKVPVTIQ